jgi:hypothetical protein
MSIKHVTALVLAIVFFGSLGSGLVYADDVVDLIKSAEKNYNAKQYKKALEDLEWVRKEIAKLQLQEMKKLLPEEIDGMKGSDSDGGAVFGLHTVSREYRDNDGNRVVTINVMSAAGGEAGGELGAIMGMAAAFGTMDSSQESKMIIEKGYRGNFSLDTDTQEGTLVFSLSGGAMVQIETFGCKDESMAKKAASKLDLPKIEEALK